LEADNIYATFNSPDQALEAADQLLNQIQSIGLGASIGIGYGEMLAVGDRDLYGNEMNLTSRLGEDLAAANEILLTPQAYQALSDPRWQLVPLTRDDGHDGVLTFFHLQRQGSL
jgi:adenylate cyclase